MFLMRSDLVDAILGYGNGEVLMVKNTGARERPSRREVARLAYQFYEKRGRLDGNDVDDWLGAERELRRHYG
jgi:hypothetical protein